MVTKKKTKPDKELLSKSRQVLEFAEEKARQVADWVELHNALFGIAGKATLLFPTESERTAFTRTSDCKRIYALFNTLPSPPVQDMGDLRANGSVSLHLPRSVHAALLAEANAEGVGLEQLCLSKLVVQLRAVIRPANGQPG